jgi:F-type H+-transporting ATPase subunit gamma
MSQQADLKNRLELYGELTEIVAAMKNLAQVELHRINRMTATQQSAWQLARQALALVQQRTPAMPEAEPVIHLVLGSERGFCAGFNEHLLNVLAQRDEPISTLWIMGSRVAAHLDEATIGWQTPAPVSADDVVPCLQRLLDQLGNGRTLRLLSHTADGVQWQTLWPQRIDISDSATPVPASLQLNLVPAVLQEQLQWQLLQQSLLYALLQSLRTENRLRLQQMEGARDHLATLMQDLQMQRNRLRQQAIVEEIEVILADRDWS